MKAEELMIGDWVAFRGCAYQCTAQDIVIMYFCEDNDTPTNTSAIPITTKILGENGAILYDTFARIDIGNYYVIYDYDGFLTICDEEDNVRKISYLECHYVHQLQHALRLCGINKQIKI